MQNSTAGWARFALAGLAIVTLAACESGPPLEGVFAELSLDTTAIEPTEAGNYVHVETEGTGDPAVEGDLMFILYRGWLTDGTEFDSSYNSDPPRPFPVVVGQGGAIPGFMEGTDGMRVGEKRHVVIPPEQGYGAQERGPIPANSTLVFEVELERMEHPAEPTDVVFADSLDVDLSAMTRSETGLYWATLEQGSGAQPTALGSRMEIHYTGWISDGTKFDSSYEQESGPAPIDVVLGETNLIPGWLEGVTGMTLGEKRRLVIPPLLAYGWGGAGGGVIPANATLVFEVELVGHTPGGG